MGNFRAIYKTLLFAVSFAIFLLMSSAVHVWTKDQAQRRRFFAWMIVIFSRWGLWFMNTKVTAKNVPKDNRNYLFVGNHLGMLDVIVLSSQKAALFITSVEMRQTPGLGTLAEMGGCLFVERRNRANIQNEIEEIRTALKQGLNVVLYPEGTSTNGEGVLPFKKSLLTSATGTGVALKPLVINYTHVNGEPMSDKWRDSVCWWGDQAFFPALWRMFKARSIHAELEFLDEIVITSDDQRREVAALAYARISEKYRPIVKPQSAS